MTAEPPPDAWQALFGSGLVVVDGGLSTQLARLGQDVSGHLWTGRVLLDRPEVVTRAHADFIAAGADVVITASYQVSRMGFAAAGLAEKDADDALRGSVAGARTAVARTAAAPTAAAGAAVRVAASVGPYGAILHDGSEYRGRYGLSRQQLADFHRERLDVLVGAAPDLLAVETIPDVLEAEALADALAGYPGTPSWIAFSAADGGHTCAGQRIEEAVQVAAAVPGVVAVGVNCTDPRHAAELIERMRATVDLPVIVYANAGGSWDPSTGGWSHGAPDDDAFSDVLIERWLAAGATAVGGCCGTDDRSISRVARVLHGRAA